MLVIDFINWLTNLFGGTAFTWSFDGSWISAIMVPLQFIAWVIPLDAVIVCFTISNIIFAIRFAVAIWKLLPLT